VSIEHSGIRGHCADTCSNNADVYLGWIGWAAGSFDTSYTLSEAPTYNNGVWTDQSLVKSCIAGKFGN